ncbi:unnamed protein product [Effrenium voratum]|nr:unnamed protein product [Effrenium voratum]
MAGEEPVEADAPLCVETLEAGAPENVDDDGGFKILRDILAYVPEDAAPGRPFGGLLPEVVIPHDMFNAMTIKLICSSIEKELFQRCYSRASVKAMSYCGLSLGSKTPSLKARSMPPGTRFYLAGTVTSEMSQNCIPLCVVSDGSTLKAPLFVSGDQHKSLFSNSLVPGWFVKPVSKNANMQYCTDKMTVTFDCLKREGEADGDTNTFKIDLPFLANPEQLPDDADMSRPTCQKPEVGCELLQVGYRAVCAASGQDAGPKRLDPKNKALKSAQHLLK